MSADASKRFSEIQREIYRHGYDRGRADATNEIHTELITEIAMLNATKMNDTDLYTFAVRIKELTDKLKEQTK